jgi:hypothetical protein
MECKAILFLNACMIMCNFVSPLKRFAPSNKIEDPKTSQPLILCHLRLSFGNDEAQVPVLIKLFILSESIIDDMLLPVILPLRHFVGDGAWFGF